MWPCLPHQKQSLSCIVFILLLFVRYDCVAKISMELWFETGVYMIVVSIHYAFQ